MPFPDDDDIGARIKEQRRLARLTQRELAERLPYSYSLLNQVECGRRAATVAFLTAVARALRIDVTALTGQTDVSASPQDRLAILVRPIRDALDVYDLGPVDGLTARPPAVLATEADTVCQLVRATHLRQASETLPGLIMELTHTAWTAPSTPVWQALASSYRTAADITLKLGFLDLSRLALDRMHWAAERASDPCLAAIRQYKRGLLYKTGHHATGLRLIAAGQQLLAGETSREALAVSGQLHLGASALAARAEDQTAVDTHLNAARELAGRVDGEAADVHWLSFGWGNADLHAFGAAVTMRQYDDALTKARKMKLPGSTMTSRRARFLVDFARVEMETGHLDSALTHLREARTAAPEQTRHYPGTRETVTGLVHLSRRAPDTLGHMARWIGL
ncbi:helix-turn-helix transcriptional regulator [Streptomyces sp. NPDC005953]|uniref:helix-turn-helix domain-containing protein n=1 Tax=Streptomyces sp. NPDC005953 TaxID=3156719 RepID=UPI0033F2EA06